MGVEVRPLGVSCNIQCLYCYQNPQRDAANISQSYDMVKIKEAIELEGGPFTLFGGEPLMLPLADLEDLWSWGHQKYKKNSIQTNGTLISDEHIALFRKYNVHIGMSLDGPGELNDVRWHGSVANTRASTAKAEAAIEKLCRERLHPSLIITLHRGNANTDKLPALTEWVRYLSGLGVNKFRLHLLESESQVIRSKFGLSTDENIDALLEFLRLAREIPQLSFDLFSDMRQLLIGEDRRSSCVWKSCDPYTTAAVRGVEGHGQRSNCGRTNKDGIDFVKAGTQGFERYVALYQTPQEFGGCKDCRFFLMCKGQCPGTAMDGDWRNRTEHCEVWKAVFEALEKELIAEGIEPLSIGSRRDEIEKRAIGTWSMGQNASVAQLLGLPDNSSLHASSPALSAE
ncbi:MAG TPA: radical SAM protein [Candidatus Angelobacter sp.]|jgi:uncharacterized protein